MNIINPETVEITKALNGLVLNLSIRIIKVNTMKPSKDCLDPTLIIITNKNI